MVNKDLVISLDDIGADDRALVGAKAYTLAQLRHEGYPVPEGFCVTAQAMMRFAAENGVTDYQHAPQADELVYPADLSQAIEEAYYWLLRNGAVAVRSSALAEDGEQSSYAGQFDTVLNVKGLEALLEAIKTCWLSQFRERVSEYASKRGHSNDEVQRIAVLVQRQVQADAAGVLFTLNPSNGDEDEMVLEAVRGLGACLVDGRETPERYIVDSLSGELRQFEKGRQRRMLVAAPGGGVISEPVPDEVSGSRVLTDELALALTRLGENVHGFFGYPQDIEWALEGSEVYLLQARPVTSISFDPGPDQWTCANHREVMPGFPSTLSVSLSLLWEYGDALADLFARLKIAKRDPSIQWGRMFFGRPYWNVGVVKRYNAVLPGFKEHAFDATVGLEPTYDGAGLVTPWTPRTVVRAIPVLVALLREYGACLHEAREYCRRFEEDIWPRISSVDLGAMDWRQLREAALDAVSLHWEANTLAMRVSALCTQAEGDFAAMVSRLNRLLPAGEEVSEGDLLTGLSGVRTSTPNLELWDLAREVAREDALRQFLTDPHYDEVHERLGRFESGRRLLRRISRFVRRYRFMAEVDEDLAYPRWDEDPSFVLKMLQVYTSADDSMNPRAQLARQEATRQRAEATAVRALSRGWRKLLIWDRWLFRQLLSLVRRYVWWREETRIVASRVFYYCRRVFLECGRHFAQEGILGAPEDVFYLDKDQFLRGLDGALGSDEARESVRRYWRTRRLYRNFHPPTTIGRGVRETFDGGGGARRCLHGVPCSGGVVTGKARVARDLSEAKALEQGEILVAPYTNPGWTPLFNVAAALVIEEGGLLSHGAVVAREFGIPTVLRVEGATKLIRTGQIIRVNGGAGNVEVIDG